VGNLVGNSWESSAAGKAGFSPFPSLPEGEGEREIGSPEIPTGKAVSHQPVGKKEMGKVGAARRNCAHVRNPWSLTPAEVDVLDAMCEKGTQKGAADRLRCSRGTIGQHMDRIAERMRLPCGLLAVLHWDRWRQGEGKGVPA